MLTRTLAIALSFLALTACGDTTEIPVDPEPMEQDFYPGVPEEQAAMVREAGRVIDPASFDIYADLVDAPPYDDVTMFEDIAYGSDAAQQLDVYTENAAPEGESRPVLLYVHGGGFVGGSKQGAYYPQSATAWAARNGMVGVNIDYRLAPENPFPAARDDLALAIEWVRDNIAEYGGDPDNIVLWGHSAGANQVADYVQHTDLQGAEAGAVKGAVLMSPAYATQMGDGPHPYYGTDASLQTAGPALERLARSDIPLMLAYAEYDPEMFEEFATAAEAQLCGAGSGEANCPEVLMLEDHNHMTEGASIGSVDESFSGPLLRWMRGL